MSHITITTLRHEDASALLEFELDNRDWFERTIKPRPQQFYTRDGVAAHIAECLQDYRDATHHPCLIRNADNVLIGRINLRNMDIQAGSAEIGCRIARHCAGQGLATGAFAHMRELARAHWGLRQIVARVSVDNPASARVLEKCGFTRLERIAGLVVIAGAAVDGYHYVCPLSPA